MPLFVFSIALFLFAAYKWIDPKPPMTFEQKLELARLYIKYERPDAAIDLLNKLLNSKITPQQAGTTHLALAEALEAGQKQGHLDLDENEIKIIEQIRAGIALSDGGAGAADYRRMGDAYMALEKPTEALACYEDAIKKDSALGAGLVRKVVELQLASKQFDKVDKSLAEYLAQKDLTPSERAWAMGEKAHLLIDDGRISDAKKILDEAAELNEDSLTQGVIHYWLGVCAWKSSKNDEAERELRFARDHLGVKQSLDADAAWTLGRIYLERRQPKEAEGFFNEVLISHPGEKLALLCRADRGVSRLMQHEDDPGLSDLHDVIKEATDKQRTWYHDEIVEDLRKGSAILSEEKNYQGALEVLAYEQTLVPLPGVNFFARLSQVYEKRGDQLDQLSRSGETNAAQAPRLNGRNEVADQIREMRTKAGDAQVALSHAMTLADDAAYGDALWHGVDLYDRAGNLPKVIWALEIFSQERPDDPLAPEASLRLGRAYHASGQFDKAIGVYQRTQFRYPKSLAASKAAVPLAQAYIAKGPDNFTKAEKVLLSVLENNPVLTPAAEEFRAALLELAQLYYRQERYEEAIARLEEFVKRYPDENRMSHLLFLMGDSYRKSANLLDAKEAVAAKKDRLAKAKKLFDDVVEIGRNKGNVDALELKLAHFYRADCTYDLGQYEDAIKLYDVAALKYQDDPSALAAYVQIVNAYCALGKTDQARAANERAKWLLRRMPDESFAAGGYTMPKNYWEQWLKWSGQVGMW